MLLKNKRILLVEDDVLNLSIISGILRKHGAKVFQDPLGHRTEMMIPYLKVDIILLDLKLDRTNIDGYDLFEYLRSKPSLKEIPIVLVTADDGALTMAKLKGFDGFIGKPIDRSIFARQIASILEGKAIWAMPESY